MKNLGEKEALASPGTAQIFWVPPIISGTGKARDFKLGWSSEHKPVKNFGKKEAWAYPGTVHIFGHPLLFQEQVKLRISNFAWTLWAQSEQKPIKKLLEKKTWALSGTPENFQGAHTQGASRSHLCDSSTFLFSICERDMVLFAQCFVAKVGYTFAINIQFA